MTLEKTWRWFGPEDKVHLREMKQMEVEGVVTSLHHIPAGEVWPENEIRNTKDHIESYGLKWSVVESLPVAEGIKLHTSDYDRLVHNYIQSLIHLSRNGIDTVCYNFMPAIDWIRTDLSYILPSGGEVMYFNSIKWIAFDVFILKRPNAENEYSPQQIEKAKVFFENLTQKQADQLAHTIIVHTQSFIHGDISENTHEYKKAFLNKLATYNDIDKTTLRANLSAFLRDIIPVAEKHGINMCIHPDDPPFSVLGLPRIVSTEEDLQWIFDSHPSLANGLTFCSGSFSLAGENNLARIVRSFGERIHFCHLRNNRLLASGDFYESGHIDGDANLPELIKWLLQEQNRRIQAGRKDIRMPVRPDHGIKMLDDLNQEYPPGYPKIGRFKGLMEIKGVEAGVKYWL